MNHEQQAAVLRVIAELSEGIDKARKLDALHRDHALAQCKRADTAEDKRDALQEKVKQLQSRICELEKNLEDMRRSKDDAYEERNRVVAALAKAAIALGHSAGIGTHNDKPGEDWDPEWRELCVIELPVGQCSWHFHCSSAELFTGLPRINFRWDGHTTPEKYERLARWAPVPSVVKGQQSVMPRVEASPMRLFVVVDNDGCPCRTEKNRTNAERWIYRDAALQFAPYRIIEMVEVRDG